MSERYQENTPETRAIKGVRAVLHGLMDHHTTQPFPAMSDHYEPEPQGYDDMGTPVPYIERTDVSQLHGWFIPKDIESQPPHTQLDYM
jgi:hypothetical protein